MTSSLKQVRRSSVSGWWLVKKNGKEGWAPSNYLELVPPKPKAAPKPPPVAARRPIPTPAAAAVVPAPKPKPVVKAPISSGGGAPVLAPKPKPVVGAKPAVAPKPGGAKPPVPAAKPTNGGGAPAPKPLGGRVGGGVGGGVGQLDLAAAVSNMNSLKSVWILIERVLPSSLSVRNVLPKRTEHNRLLLGGRSLATVDLGEAMIRTHVRSRGADIFVTAIGLYIEFQCLLLGVTSSGQ